MSVLATFIWYTIHKYQFVILYLEMCIINKKFQILSKQKYASYIIKDNYTFPDANPLLFVHIQTKSPI